MTGIGADALAAQVAQLCAAAAAAMRRATDALLLVDVQAAEAVLSGGEIRGALCGGVDETVFGLLATQPSTAAELRVIVNAIRSAVDAEQMSAVADDVAAAVRNLHPQRLIAPAVHGRIAELGEVVIAMAGVAQEILLSDDPRLADRIRADGLLVDELYCDLLVAVAGAGWPAGAAAGVDAALMARNYLRFAEHAGRIGERFLAFPVDRTYRPAVRPVA